jgi:alpha-glucosidase
MTDPKLTWWQSAVFYQIYPRSFADGNGDGIGDLPGIIARLDYLSDLGIDAIWLSPHYPSPNYDCGYDISGFTAVAPEYGTMDDFRRFLDGVHQRGMRLILDLVLNHTSDQHPWFTESRSSRNNSKRDWYVWHPGDHGGPPNNWYSTFGGSAWELDPHTGEYYYHCFFKQQPDLNWRNPQVKQAMFDATRFWLELGVDGFRLDAVETIFEHPDLPDQPVQRLLSDLQRALLLTRNQEEQERLIAERRKMFQYQIGLQEVHGLMQELRRVVNDYDDRVLIGETDDLRFYGDGQNELHMQFNFSLMRAARLTPAYILDNQRRRLSRLARISPNAWPCNTFGNHDSTRVYTRYGYYPAEAISRDNDAQARLVLLLVLTLRGTPVLYNGEELGMTDLYLDDLADFRDLIGVWFYEVSTTELGMLPAEALEKAARASRDRCRTPFQWSNAPNGGFSPEGIDTWLPVNPNYRQGINLEKQMNDPGSMVNYYRELLALRKENPALIQGDYLPLDIDDEDALVFLRQTDGQNILIAFNFSSTKHLTLDLNQALAGLLGSLPDWRMQRLFSTKPFPETEADLSGLALQPLEAQMIVLKAA